MLSIENPPPTDPPCSHLTSPLKSSSGDERDSSSGKLVEKVDLSQSALDDKSSNNPPSNFSIRDYVFGSRSKNIKTNWPFSQKCLQLCLEHGVKDLLPPFQSVDNLRNQPVKKPVVENTPVDKQNIIVSDGDFSRPSDYSLPELASESVNINSVRSQGDKASQSCSEIDSVPAARSSCLEFETNILPESRKARGQNKVPSAKKCSVTVKLSSTEEDTRTSNFAVSESMAAKTCPVCKSFSSSSNTTLNAHIDQCLSGESTTIKWTSNCEVSKHRMRPRKTRLMVDIYTTAQRCTLEDLDRRNGTNFAVYPSFPAEETDGCADNKNETWPPVNLGKTCDEGAVYIDANGTKVRILSKFNDGEAGCSRVFHDSAPKKFVKGDKGPTFLSTKKKKKHKSHEQKYHKILKSAAYSKKLCSPSPHSSEIDSAQERSFARKQNTEKEECLTQRLRSQDNIKFSESGTIRPWSCSKRTGVTRKMCDPQGSGGGLGNEVYERPANSFANRSCALRPLNPSVKPACFQKIRKRLEDVPCDSHDDDSEQPYLRKRLGLPLIDSQISHGNKRSSVLHKRKEKHLNVDDHHSAHYCGRGTTHDINHASSQRNLKSSVNAVPLRNADNFIVNRKPSTFSHAFSSKAKKFSSLRKNLLLVSQASTPECRPKKSQVPCMSKSDEEEYDEQYDSAENQNEFHPREDEVFVRSDTNTAKVLKIRKKWEESKKDEIVGMRPCIQDTGKNNSPSFSFGCDSEGESDDEACDEDDVETNRKDNEMETTSDLAAGRHFISFNKHTVSGIDSLVDPPKSHADTQLFGGEFERPFICGQTSGDDQEMFTAADIGKTIVPPDIHVDTELESSEFHGYYHLEVDPIPIPGPPGSFLPSPGRMCSEDQDLQGNSSLTSSRLQSSEDHPELFDRDSSYSPVSATSTLSNFTVARSDSRSSEKSDGNPRLYRSSEKSDGNPRLYTGGIEKNKSSFSNDSIDPVVENSTAVLGAINAGEERCDLDDMKINVTLPKKGFRFKSDQPCCCARKEGASQSFGLSHQESPLLQRRTISSTPLPVSERLQSGNSSRRPDNPSLVVNMISMEDPSPSPKIHEHTKVSGDTEVVKVPCRTGCGSVSPSASNPVLRLMGKNLLVVNKDESISPQEKRSQTNFTTEANMQFSAVPGIHCGNFQSILAQNLDVGSSSGYKSHGNYSTPPQRLLHSPVFSGKSDLMGSFVGGYTLITEQIGVGNKLDAQTRTPLSSSAAHSQNAREIIVINDSPESEDDASNSKGLIDGRRYPVSIPIIPSGYNPNYADLYGYNKEYKPPHDSSTSYTGSGAAVPRGVNTGIPVQWNCYPESSSTVHTKSLTSPSSSTRHLGSSVYYTPGFS